MPERIPNGVAKKVVFRAIASADHFTPATGKTIAITISKNGAVSFSNPAAGATNATEMASGFYKFDLGTGDTDTNGPLAWRAAGTGVDDIGDVYEVVAATNGGFSALPAVASGSAGGVITSGTGTAQLSVSSGLVTLAGVTHTGAVIPTVTTLTGHTPQTGDAFARLGAPLGSSVAADLLRLLTTLEPAVGSPGEYCFSADALRNAPLTPLVGGAFTQLQVDLDDIQTRLPASLVGGRMDASVGAMASGVLTATAIAADAITDAKVASDVTIASVTGAVGSVTGAVGSVTGNVGGNVTGSVGSVTGLTASDVGAIKITVDRLGTTLEAGAGSPGEFRFSADSLVNAPNSTGPSAATIAVAVWDEAISGHLTSGTTGAALNAAGSAGDPWSTPLPGAYGAGTAGFIVADILGVTDKLDTTLTPATGSPGEYQFTADALRSAPTGSSGGSAPSAAAVAAAVWAEALPGGYSAGQAGKIVGDNVNATISSRATQTSVDTIDTNVDAILVDTAEIGAAGAGLTAIASAANLATLTGYVDTEVAAILAAVDTEVAAIKAKTDNLPAAPAATGDIPSAAAVADAIWDEPLSGHVTGGSAGAALRDADLRGSRTVIRGTVGSATTPSTTQFTPSVLTPAGVDANQFQGRIIVWDNDTTTTALRGEATDITASSAASLPLFTFTALTSVPQSGDTFSIV